MFQLWLVLKTSQYEYYKLTQYTAILSNFIHFPPHSPINIFTIHPFYHNRDIYQIGFASIFQFHHNIACIFKIMQR